MKWLEPDAKGTQLSADKRYMVTAQAPHFVAWHRVPYLKRIDDVFQSRSLAQAACERAAKDAA